MGKINERRIDAMGAIAAVVMAGVASTYVPTAGIESAKQVCLGVADVTMCVYIWKVYFKEEISNDCLLKTLGTAGIITVAAGGVGWVIAKGASGALHEVANWFGPVGWTVSGIIVGSSTALLGLAVMWFCDNKYRELHPELSEKSSIEELKKLWAAFIALIKSIGSKRSKQPAAA